MRSPGRRSALTRWALAPALILTLAACSTAPGEQAPTRETQEAASEYAVFGNTFYRQGRYAEAEEMYLYSLEYYKRIDDRAGIVRAYNSLGKTYLVQQRGETAEKLFDAALAIVENLREDGELPSGEIALLEAETLNNLGEMALSKKLGEEALQLFQRGIESLSARENGRSQEMAVLLHNRGGVYKSRGELDRAEEDFTASLEMNEKADRYQEMASNYYMLSSTSFQRGDLTSARRYGARALELDKRTENSIGIAQDLIGLGHIEAAEGNTAKAGDYYIRAYRIYQSLQLESRLRKVVGYLEEVGAAGLLDGEVMSLTAEVDSADPPLPESGGNAGGDGTAR